MQISKVLIYNNSKYRTDMRGHNVCGKITLGRTVGRNEKGDEKRDRSSRIGSRCCSSKFSCPKQSWAEFKGRQTAIIGKLN